MKALHPIRLRLRHFVRAGYWRGHHIHSPYCFHLVREVISARERDTDLVARVRAYRKDVQRDTTVIRVEGLGAVRRPALNMRVDHLAKRTGTSLRYGLMLARIARDVRPDAILELGTSLGMSTACLAAALPATPVVSLEGSPEVADTTRRHLAQHGMNNVRVETVDIDESLERVLDELPGGKVQMAFVDANHSYEATLRYFGLLKEHAADFCVLVFDDIYWSEGMTAAWQKIVEDERVMSTFELPQMGIAVFRTGCQKEHYMVRW